MPLSSSNRTAPRQRRRRGRHFERALRLTRLEVLHVVLVAAAVGSLFEHQVLDEVRQARLAGRVLARPTS
jgi:hypothetical protein